MTSDAARFEALYRAHYAALVRFARRRDPERAEEVVAETFAIAWRRLDGVPAEALPWLYGVARNVLLGARRSANRAADLEQRLAPFGRHGRDPADALAERDLVLRAFATLSEADREALRLVAWEGLDQRAAARVLGMSRAAFAMRVSRARRRLAAALTDAPAPVPEAQP